MIIQILRDNIFKPSHWLTIVSLGVWRPLRTRLRIYCWGMYHVSYYPESIRRKNSLIKSEFKKSSKNIKQWYFFAPRFVGQTKKIFEINCAGCELYVSQLLNIWGSIYDKDLDPEIIQSSYRFHWLVDFLADGVSNDDQIIMLELIKHWLDVMEENCTGFAWQPYNVSERVCNWIVFWQCISMKNTLPDFSEKWLVAIHNNVIYLADNLEYPASGIINNHILNNARALYIAGRFLEDETITDLGRELLRHHLPEMIGGSGFLKESSSHYQLLLTRSVLEVQKVAQETLDQQFLRWLDFFSDKMLVASQKLLPDELQSLNDMPRIGDVSPDIPFDWFSPVSIRLQANWNSLWAESTDLKTNDGLLDCDGWLSIKREHWFALVFSHPDKDSYPAGHGHNDFGSFCLYFFGWPIVIDIGRFDYTPESNDVFKGSEAEMHNTVIVDQSSLLPVGRGLSSVISTAARKVVKCLVNNDFDEIRWSGISKTGAIWHRKLCLVSPTEVNLIDQISRAGVVRGFVNFTPEAVLNNDSNHSYNLAIGSYRFNITVIGANKSWLEESPFFPHYGVRSLARRLCWEIERGDEAMKVEVRILRN
jgi:hypothetical protein